MLAQRFKLENTNGLTRYFGIPLQDYVNVLVEENDNGSRVVVAFSDDETTIELPDPIIVLSKVGAQPEAVVMKHTIRNLAKRGLLAKLGSRFVKIDSGEVLLVEDTRNLLPEHTLHLSVRYEKCEGESLKQPIYYAELVHSCTFSNETAALIRKILDAVRPEIPSFIGTYNAMATIENGVFRLLLNNDEKAFVTADNKLIALKPLDFAESGVDASALLEELAVLFNATEPEQKKKLFAAFLIAALARVCLLDQSELQLTGLPMLIITGKTPGAGKTALATALANVADVTGLVTLKTHTESDELRKHLATIALAGARVFVLDNIARRSSLTQEILSAAATGRLGIRLLGKNEEVTICNPLIIATGLDLEFSDEIARRTIKIENERADDDETVTLFGESMPRWQAVSKLMNNRRVCERIASTLLRMLDGVPLVSVSGARSFTSLRIINGLPEIQSLSIVKSETENHFGTQIIRELTRLVLLEPESGVAEIYAAEGLKADEGAIKERLDKGDLCELLSFVEAAYINGDFTPYRRTRLPIDCVKASLSNGVITISFAPNVIVHRLAAYLQEDTTAKGMLGELHAINKRDRIADFVTSYEHIYAAIKKELRSSFKSEAVGGAMKIILRLANSLEDDERITYTQTRDTTHKKCAVVEIVYSVDKFKKYIGEIPIMIKNLKTETSEERIENELAETVKKHFGTKQS